jgi:hypothetical protein
LNCTALVGSLSSCDMIHERAAVIEVAIGEARLSHEKERRKGKCVEAPCVPRASRRARRRQRAGHA